jgi:para-nitrobenzyl esterase
MKMDTRRSPLPPAALAAALALALAACSSDAAVPDAPADAPAADAAPADAGPADAGGQPVVQTDSGPLAGAAAGGVVAFLGVPYAAPPLGALRWRPPQPPASWTAPRPATAVGPACPQQGPELTAPTGPTSEDCLTLNVWTPALAPAAPLPVLVFIHGGGFRNGGTDRPLYDGAALAAQAPAVVVTMNYRLGPLGFLAHPELSAEDAHGSSGNYGLLDQQAALRWVQRNVAAFGGDPAQVTLFGESAGAISACLHVTSPLAAGLFRRALGESGPCVTVATPLHDQPGATRTSAEARGLAYAQAAGCADVACLRGKSVAELLAAVPPDQGLGFLGAFSPSVDGYVVAEPPAAALAAGRTNGIGAFIGGVNRDEATLFTRAITIADAAQYEAEVRALLPARADTLLALYPASAYATPKDAFDALVTDLVFVCPTRLQTRLLAARGTATYQYLWSKLTAFGRAAQLGVYHGSELPFIFGNLSATSGTGAAERALSAELVGYLGRYAVAGDPNGAGAPAWPARTADAATDAYLEIDDTTVARSGLHDGKCATIEPWLTAP